MAGLAPRSVARGLVARWTPDSPARPGLDVIPPADLVSDSAVTFRTVSDVAGVERLAPQWADLCDRTDAPALTHPSFALAWLTNEPSGPPRVVTAHRDGRLVGVLALHERRRFGLSVLRFIGHGLGAVQRPVVDGVAPEVLLGAAVADRRTILEAYEYAAPVPNGVVGAWSSISERDVCPVIEIPSEGVDALIAAGPKELRRTVRRADRRLSDENLDVHVEVLTDAGAVAAVIPELDAIYGAAERAMPRQNLLAGAERAMLLDLLRRSADAQRLHLFVTRIGGRTANFDVVFAGATTFAVWLGRMHPDFRDFSPGYLSLRAIVAAAHETGRTKVDLMIGDQRYKRRWATTRYATHTLRAAQDRSVLVAARAGLRRLDDRD